ILRPRLARARRRDRHSKHRGRRNASALLFISDAQRNLRAFMAHHRLSPRQYAILGLVALCAPLGDTCLSRGMTNLPPITLAHPGTLIAAVFTPWVGAGIALL